MEYVEPIRDRKKLDAMKTYLRGRNLRDYCLFVLGINSGLRISDLLSLTIGDVAKKTQSGFEAVDRIELREKKTNKSKDFPLSSHAKFALEEYLQKDRSDASLSEPLFLSKKGGTISRVQAWNVLNEAGKAVGVKGRIGTHTMRKTFGYWAYRSGVDVSVIQQLLNHSSPGVTLRYIGITKDNLDSVYRNLNL